MCVSVAAGALIGRTDEVYHAMLVGTGFVGGFMFVSAVWAQVLRRRREAMLGGILAIVMPIGAWFLGGSNAFIWVLGVAAILSLGSLLLARQNGLLAPSSVVLGTATLSAAAPAAALGAGANALAALVLYGLLWPCFCWRTLYVASIVTADAPGVRPALRRRGLREASIAAIWAVLAVITVRCLRL